jgi:hypothetical protein
MSFGTNAPKTSIKQYQRLHDDLGNVYSVEVHPVRRHNQYYLERTI